MVFICFIILVHIHSGGAAVCRPARYAPRYDADGDAGDASSRHAARDDGNADGNGDPGNGTAAAWDDAAGDASWYASGNDAWYGWVRVPAAPAQGYAHAACWYGPQSAPGDAAAVRVMQCVLYCSM